MEMIIKTAQSFINDHLLLHTLIIALSMAAMLLAMAIDLIAGIHKAKQRGQATTSQGLKKTAAKAEKYFMPYLVTVCIDVIVSVAVPVPAFSMLWATYCCLCEWKSVREKWWQKEEIAKQQRTMSIIIENKDDIIKMIKELIEETEKK